MLEQTPDILHSSSEVPDPTKSNINNNSQPKFHVRVQTQTWPSIQKIIKCDCTIQPSNKYIKHIPELLDLKICDHPNTPLHKKQFQSHSYQCINKRPQELVHWYQYPMHVRPVTRKFLQIKGFQSVKRYSYSHEFVNIAMEYKKEQSKNPETPYILSPQHEQKGAISQEAFFSRHTASIYHRHQLPTKMQGLIGHVQTKQKITTHNISSTIGERYSSVLPIERVYVYQVYILLQIIDYSSTLRNYTNIS